MRTTVANMKPARTPDAHSPATSETATWQPADFQSADRPAVILNANGAATVRATRTRALRKSGYSVIEAANCTEALQVGIQRVPDLVVINGLSRSNDLKICAQFRANPAMRDIPLISLCSAQTIRHVRYADSCFLEPVKPATLISIIGLALRAKAAERRVLEMAASAHRLTAMADTEAHDLLSPLCTISSLAAWIRGEYEDQLGAGGREYIGLLEQSVDRMREVITRIFAVSVRHGKLDSGLTF